jgi:serine/threonine protein kinase
MPFSPARKTPSTELEDQARYIARLKNFEFKQFLGAGAFKECFWVVDQSGQSLALKLLKPGCSRQRLDREIDAMSQCNHPHIAKLHEVGTVDINGSSQELMIEELLEGGNLQEYMMQRGPLTPEQCADIGAKLIDALAHIAQRHIVHRDIKPANVMFRSDLDSPVFVDFGLVRNLGDTSLTQTWLHRGPGTPIFSSAEQLNNEKELIDWRSDQFSLGVSLSLATFGNHPFRQPGDTDVAVVERVASREAVPAAFIDKARAANLLALTTMMAPWPVNRFRTPKNLQEAWTLGR